MLGWQFRQELEHVHTVHELARHLEGFLNAGYAVWTKPDGASVLLPDTAALEPYQDFTLELLDRDHRLPSFRVKGKDIDAAFDLLDCSLLRGAVNRKSGGLIVYWHGMVRSKLIDLWWATQAKSGTGQRRTANGQRVDEEHS
jgi:hypothetical protein